MDFYIAQDHNSPVLNQFTMLQGERVIEDYLTMLSIAVCLGMLSIAVCLGMLTGMIQNQWWATEVHGFTK